MATFQKVHFFVLLTMTLISQTVWSNPIPHPDPNSDKVKKGRDYEAIGSPQDEVFLTKYRVAYKGIAHTRIEGELALIPNPEKVDFKVPFLYYKSRYPGPRPLIIIPPNLEGITPLEMGIAIYFAKQGFSSLLFLPNLKIQDMDRAIEDFDGVFKVALFSLKMMIDWAHTKPEDFETSRIGAFGMSLGGILSAMLLGQDSRVGAGYIFAAGGDIPSIMANSDQKYLKEYRQKTISSLKLDGRKEYEQALRDIMTLDPTLLAINRPSENVYMVLGSKDTVVPYANQKILWEAMGRPHRHVVPFNHAGTVFKAPWHLDKILSFFCKNWSWSHGNPNCTKTVP